MTRSRHRQQAFPPTPDSAEGGSAALETSFSELNGILEKLESDESLELSDSIALFERGMALLKSCESILQQAEQKVLELTESGEAVGRTGECARGEH